MCRAFALMEPPELCVYQTPARARGRTHGVEKTLAQGSPTVNSLQVLCGNAQIGLGEERLESEAGGFDVFTGAFLPVDDGHDPLNFGSD